jgi:transposase
METTLRMSMKERMRLEIFSRVKRGGISLGKAALLARVSRRQAKRIWRRYRLEGDAGLVHRLRGRPGNAGKVEVRDEVLALCRVKYADFGSALAAEYLLKEGQEVSRQTLWRWRRQATFSPAAVRRGTALDVSVGVASGNLFRWTVRRMTGSRGVVGPVSCS